MKTKIFTIASAIILMSIATFSGINSNEVQKIDDYISITTSYMTTYTSIDRRGVHWGQFRLFSGLELPPIHYPKNSITIEINSSGKVAIKNSLFYFLSYLDS